MKLYFSPDTFHLYAQRFSPFRWRFLSWSLMLLALFVLVQSQISSSTPTPLLWLAFLLLFSGLQLLVFSAFILFFLQLPSHKEARKALIKSTQNKSYWYQLYRLVEWCEAILFFILLPLPTLIFFYALITVS
jgi:hypothetical protein